MRKRELLRNQMLDTNEGSLAHDWYGLYRDADISITIEA